MGRKCRTEKYRGGLWNLGSRGKGPSKGDVRKNEEQNLLSKAFEGRYRNLLSVCEWGKEAKDPAEPRFNPV